MQVPVLTICYTAANVSNPADRVATGFPLPSTGRGIEGEGWSYPEPPPARASGGGRSRAATSFACGAGTLWRGFAGGLAHDAMAIQTTQLSQSFPKLNAGSLLKNSICKYLFLQYVTPLPTSPIQLAASPLASLSPQRGEGLRVRGGHIRSHLPREPPVVDEVALRLRLPAEQALCGVASPGACA